MNDRVTAMLLCQETGASETETPVLEGNRGGGAAFSPLLVRVGGFLSLVFAGLLAIAVFLTLQPKTDGYTHQVLTLTGDPAHGRAIFVMNCVACHGQWADGEVGPSLRGVGEKLSPQQLVHQVVSGQTPPMPQFQPSPQEMADLLSYLRKL